MKLVFSIILLFLTPMVFGQDLQSVLDKYNDHSIPYILPSESMELAEEVWFLDAREQEEYEVSHIPEAIYIGFKDFSKEKILGLLPNKDAPIIVYCSIGVRSEKIAKQLQSLGFLNVRNLYGGIFEWVNNGFPLEDNEGISTEKVHAFSKQWGRYLEKGEKVY